MRTAALFAIVLSTTISLGLAAKARQVITDDSTTSLTTPTVNTNSNIKAKLAENQFINNRPCRVDDFHDLNPGHPSCNLTCNFTNLPGLGTGTQHSSVLQAEAT